MDIATHIAYLIGDHKRVIVPEYDNQHQWLTLIDSDSNEYNSNTSNKFTFFPTTHHPPLEPIPLDELTHPDGVTGIFGVGLAATFSPSLGWVGSLTSLHQNFDYHITYTDPSGAMMPLNTNAYGLQRPIDDGGDGVARSVLNQWLKESIITVSKLMPTKYKLHMVGSKLFTSEELDDANNYTSIFDYSSDIISVSRYHGDMLYECRMIPYSQRHKAKLNSGFLDECSIEDPVYAIAPGGIIRVYPTLEEANYSSNTSNDTNYDGLCNVDYINYPNLDVVDDDFIGVPVDVQQTVLVSTAVKVKSYQISSLNLPDAPTLSEEFKVVLLDKPDITDAIEKAQNIVDNYGDYGFNKLLEAEDIELAMTALKGSAQELEIAKTQLTEQDKAASEYLSEYSQNISKFGQELGAYNSKYKKLSSELDNLKSDYQEHIYSLRGELPNKKQLKDTERKLESIKQVVNKG